MNAKNQPLAGRTTLITGAARGIGEAAARQIASAGGAIVLIDINIELLTRVSKSLGDAVVHSHAVDIRYAAALQAVASELQSRKTTIDVLINNAAVYSQGPLLELPMGEFERCIDVNLHGLVGCCRTFTPLMAPSRRPQIINVLSEFAWLPFPNKASYCASKAAAAMASACLRTELASRGIRVTDFIPPAVDTGLVSDAVALDPRAIAREAEVLRAHAKPADDVGRAIVRSILRPRNTVYCGLLPRLAVTAARIAPSTTRAAAARAAVRLGLATRTPSGASKT